MLLSESRGFCCSLTDRVNRLMGVRQSYEVAISWLQKADSKDPKNGDVFMNVGQGNSYPHSVPRGTIRFTACKVPPLPTVIQELHTFCWRDCNATLQLLHSIRNIGTLPAGSFRGRARCWRADLGNCPSY
eukprot:476791-Prorocentrum_minimum.AAC.2